MDILILSNMYPSNEKTYAGIFVRNQEKKLKEIFENKHNIYLHVLKRTFTNELGSLKKYLVFYLSFFIKFLGKKLDIIHVHYYGWNFIVVFIYKIFWPKTKIIVTIHGGDIQKKIKKGSLKAKLFYWISFKIDYIISVGSGLSNDIKRKIGRTPDKIIPAGVDHFVFFPLNKIDKKFDFVFAGSFFKDKGIPLLIDAIAYLNNEKISFCFIGSGPLKNEIEALSEKGYNVQVFGPMEQEKLNYIYNQSRFLILPSIREAFGLVVAEGLACGLPAIVSNIPAFHRQIEDKKNGFLIKKRTPDHLGKLITEAKNLNWDEYYSMSFSAIQKGKLFSLNTVCHKLKKIYELEVWEK